MTKIGFFAAWLSTRKASKLTPEEMLNLQRERASKLMQHARRYSRYYAEKYAGLPADVTLADLPPVSKRELMARFEDWVTDPAIKLAELRNHIASPENIGREYLGKYLVCTTSGSTGVPAIFLYDKSSMNVMNALAATRSMAYKGVMSKLVKRGGRSAAVYATGGHYLGVASVRNRQMKNRLKAKQFAVYSVLWPMEEIVEKLNKFQPALLGGYPTALELLISEQQSGRLRIQPALINTGGEHLSRELAKCLSEAFGCPVQTSYSCTEGGLIAFQCSEGHLHINSDWVIVEPVDASGRPVPAGTLADKVYITNLTNYVQPVIRYEVTDRIRFLADPCPCGSLLPAIEVEGRTDDILEFVSEAGKVRIPPLAAYVILNEVPGVVRFQLIQSGDNHLDLRLETAGDNAAVREEVMKRLAALLREKGAEPSITFSEQPPAAGSSGKFRHVYKRIEQK